MPIAVAASPADMPYDAAACGSTRTTSCGISTICSVRQIDQAGDPSMAASTRSATGARWPQILTEHLDRQGRALSGDHVLDPVRDGLPQGELRPRHRLEPLADVGEDLLPGAGVVRA
jgi:hypothetical protein